MKITMREVLILIAVVLLFSGVVGAQDNGPATEDPDGITVTVPGDGEEDGVGGIPPYQFIGLVGLVVFVLLFTAYESHSGRKLHLEAIDRLYHSTPPFVREPAFGFVSGVGDNILAGLDELADATTWTNLDNEAQDRLAEYWHETKARWQQLKQGFTPPLTAQSDPTRDKMISIRDAEHTLLANGWTLSPPEGYDNTWLDRANPNSPSDPVG